MSDHLKSEQSAFYHIEVQGALSSSWSDYLGGLKISVKSGQGISYTILEGELLDQAALMGVLDSLYNLGFPLLMVVYQPISIETQQLKDTT